MIDAAALMMAAAAVFLGASSSSVVAVAAEATGPTVHPIYAHVQDAPQNDLALQRFSTATRRFGLGPVEIVEVEGDAVPLTADRLRAGVEQVRKLDFDPGLLALEDAAAQAAATGGAGLDTAALSDLFLFRAWAISRVDFNKEHIPATTARARAYADLLRAAALTPARQFNPQQFPPFLLEDWVRATADLTTRPQSKVLVRAAPEALVTFDGGPPVPGPATFVGVAAGEHLIRIDEPGWAAWGATISVDGPAVEIQVPPRRPLTLEDDAAAARARRMGAKFALVGEPRPGRDGGLSIALRLVDATGARQDAVIEPLAGDAGALDAAVMRLDEEARRLDRAGTAPPPLPAAVSAFDPTSTPGAALPPPVLLAPSVTRSRLDSDPASWAREHWPLLTAIGVMAGTALLLSATM